MIEMNDWKCGRCGTVYSFEEFIGLMKIMATEDAPTHVVCKHCDYRFHMDKPVWKAGGEIKHHITCLHWFVNKLTRGRLAPPHPIDIELSTVFLELAHDDWFGEGTPNWYESMFFVSRPGQRERVVIETSTALPRSIGWSEGKNPVDCWLQRRYRTEEEALEGHRLLRGLLEGGKYLVTYALDKVDSEDPESKYHFEWRIDFSERHRRILHGAKLNSDFEGTAVEIPAR